MHDAFRDMFGKVKSYRWTGAFIKDDHRFPNRRQLQEGATLAMKRAPHVELRVAPRRTPHRLDFGLAELVRLVVFRRSDGKPSNSAATCPWSRVSLPSRAKLKKALTNTIRLTATRSA
jgi:hypothetical protein